MNDLRTGSEALLLGIVLLLAGCREDVTAVLGTDQPFTLWGVLSPLSDTQFVRVFPIEGTLNPGRDEPLAVRFVSTDVSTAGELVWRDSVIVDDRGIVGHVFYAPFRAEYGHKYRLEISGEDGRSSAVEVTVPANTNLTLDEPDTTQGVLLPGYVLNNPPRLIRSELVFRTGYVAGFSSGGCPLYTRDQFVVPYDDRIRSTEGGWWFIVNLREVFNFVEALALEDGNYLRPFGITLAYMRFDTIVANDAWSPPGGTFDPDVLVEPGLMSNIENGFGFVGAGFNLSRTWTLPSEVIEKSGFRADYEEC